MAVKIRLRRMGGKKKPFFRIVAADSRSSNVGNFLEELGWYDPKRRDVNYSIDMARVDYWQGQGAEISDTVNSIVRKARKAAPAAAAAAAPAPQA